MKEISEFPNIKAKKLEEEINKDNYDIQNNSINIKKIKKESKNKEIKYCLLYIISFSFFISLFVLNYLKTKDAFKNNKYINLSPEKLCNKTIKAFSECVKERKLIKCQIEEKNVELCYDESYSLNQICFAYLSELELCMRNNNNQTQNCGTYIYEVVKCGAIFRHIQLDKEYLKEIII